MAKRSKVTVAEVAEAAGVSTATVSLVFNNKGEVAEATRARVREIGTRMGYEPGWISKIFRSGHSHVLGVAVGHQHVDIWQQTYLPYYRGIIAGAAIEALDHGYSIAAVPISESGELAGPIPLDGVIIVDPAPGDNGIRTALAQGIAVIAEGGVDDIAPHPLLRSVRSDVTRGIPAALDALTHRGARHPAFFRGDLDDRYTTESERAYRSWCTGKRIEPVVLRLKAGQTPIEGARELLTSGVDSAHCLNESYSTAVIAAAAADPARDFRVSVAAEEHVRQVDPRLVYAGLDPVASGTVCARTLVDLLAGGDPDDVLLPMPVYAPDE